MAGVLFLLYFFIGCPFLTHAASVESTDELTYANKALTQEATWWIQKFGRYVQNDQGYLHFLRTLGPNKTCYKASPDFEEVAICTTLSMLRCATCYAMVLSNTDEKILSEALTSCQDYEVYQVFVAADSYYKGCGSSRNFAILKTTYETQSKTIPSVLYSPGAPLFHHDWLTKKIHEEKQKLFLHQFPWLQAWAHSREEVEEFLQEECDPNEAIFFICYTPPGTITNKLLDKHRTFAYFLHHLEKSDIFKQAPTFITTLYDSKAFSVFHATLRETLPFDPHKAEILHLLDDIFAIHTSALALSAPSGSRDTTLPIATLDLLQSWGCLTQRNWHYSQQFLRAHHIARNTACTTPENVEFAEDTNLPTMTTKAGYYAEHHAPLIFEKHKTVAMDPFQTLLETHASHEERKGFSSTHIAINSPTHLIGQCLTNRNFALQTLYASRCCMLWRMAKTEPLYQHFWSLYSGCTIAEKRALYVNANLLENSDVRKQIFCRGKAEETRYLGRVSIRNHLKDIQ